MIHTQHTSTRVISAVVISTLVIGALITLVTSIFLSACTPQDACTNLIGLCPSMEHSTCVSTLKEQEQDIIDCIYSASTCEDAHECLNVEEE